KRLFCASVALFLKKIKKCSKLVCNFKNKYYLCNPFFLRNISFLSDVEMVNNIWQACNNWKHAGKRRKNRNTEAKSKKFLRHKTLKRDVTTQKNQVQKATKRPYERNCPPGS
ncbi:MAG: hypothetical protein LBD87_00875, partial [Prevotellaceae bacterium]|nr:hypothetical protein [Prevotellaceae bacterium]